MRRRLPIRTGAWGILFVGAVASASAQTDDSGWINEAIRTAIATRKTSYVLPARTLYLAQPIVIPGGTRNFALRGRRVRTEFTKLVPMASMTYTIQIGFDTNLTGRPAIALQNVPDRSRYLTLAGTGGELPRGNYLLADATKLRGVQEVRFELVQGRAWDAARRRMTLAAAVGREFDNQPYVRNVDGFVSENIRVETLTMDATGTGHQVHGMLNARLVRGLTARYLTAIGFTTNGIAAEKSSRITFDRCYVKPVSTEEFGNGYGLQINQSRFGTIRNSEGDDCRHTVMICGGATDVLVSRVTSRHPRSGVGCGSIDTHGSDERRIRIEYTTAPIISLGNTSWGAGAKDVTLRNVTADWIAFRPNVQRVTATSSTFQKLWFEWGNDPGLRPTDPTSITDLKFVRCTLVSGRWAAPVSQANLNVGKLEFIQSEFRTNRWPAVQVDNSTVDFVFTSCRFAENTTNPFIILNNSNLRGRYTLKLRGNRFTAIGTMPVAVRTGNQFLGTVQAATDNVVIGPNGSTPPLTSPGVSTTL